MRPGRTLPAFLAAVLALVPPSVRAAAIVHDGPDARPIADLYRDEDGEMDAPPPTPPAPPSAAAIRAAILPLIPQRLTVGEEPTRPLPLVRGARSPRTLHPLFLVGTDRASLAWLAAHAVALRKLAAVGLIVQADTDADVARARQQAPSLPMFAIPGDDLAAQLGIRHYPVVVGPDSIRSSP